MSGPWLSPFEGRAAHGHLRVTDSGLRHGSSLGFTCQTARGYASAFSRHKAPELCLSFRPPLKAKGAGKAGCTLHPRSRVQSAQKETHTSIQVQRRHSGFPCAMGYGLLRALPGERLFCHRRPRKLAFANLNASTAASGPHDFAVRVRRLTSAAPFASTASHRAFVTWPTPLNG